MTNLVLVDVDFTLSPDQYPSANVDVFDGEVHGQHPVPRALFDDIEALDGVKMWLTTWEHDAEWCFRRGWEVAGDGRTKAECALAAARAIGATKVVWLDDEFASDIPGFPTLAIRPRIGLTPDDLARAKAFLDA